MPNIRTVKRKSWQFYSTWRQIGSYSPVFATQIRISLRGWNHITGSSGAKKRTAPDTIRRLKLLPLAKQIIETSTTIQNITVRNERKYYALEAIINDQKIRVILIEDKKGNKIFYSVMNKKSETPHA